MNLKDALFLCIVFLLTGLAFGYLVGESVIINDCNKNSVSNITGYNLVCVKVK